MYGPDAMEETKHTIWLKVENVLKILNVSFGNRLIDHLSNLQQSPDLMLMECYCRYMKKTNP